MKVKFFHIYLTFILITGGALTLSAQPQHEGLSPKEFQDPSHLELNLNEDKTLLFEQDSKVKTPKDTVLSSHSKFVAPPKTKSGEPGKPFTGKNEDDALSFNFLYYIIQKFKISDLIDQ